MQQQKGMTLIRMLFTVLVLFIAALVIMRVVPVYLEHDTIVKSVKTLNATPLTTLTGDPAANVVVLRGNLNKLFDINNIEYFKDKQLEITPLGQENKYLVILKYQVIKSLIFNISLLFDFNDTIEVTVGSEH